LIQGKTTSVALFVVFRRNSTKSEIFQASYILTQPNREVSIYSTGRRALEEALGADMEDRPRSDGAPRESGQGDLQPGDTPGERNRKIPQHGQLLPQQRRDKSERSHALPLSLTRFTLLIMQEKHHQTHAHTSFYYFYHSVSSSSYVFSGLSITFTLKLGLFTET
jgi:hypothetical protein